MFMYFVCRIVEWTEIENMDVDLILSKDHQRNGWNTTDSYFIKCPYGDEPQLLSQKQQPPEKLDPWKTRPHGLH